ncbi:MAG: hypothetical protein ACRD1G_15935 [Acidimicrobiales bacterium]
MAPWVIAVGVGTLVFFTAFVLVKWDGKAQPWSEAPMVIVGLTIGSWALSVIGYVVVSIVFQLNNGVYLS